MREICQSGSEGGGTEIIQSFLPYQQSRVWWRSGGICRGRGALEKRSHGGAGRDADGPAVRVFDGRFGRQAEGVQNRGRKVVGRRGGVFDIRPLAVAGAVHL